MSSRLKKRSRVDNGVRKTVLSSFPNTTFDEGTDKLLRLGSLLFLERLAHESREVASLEGKRYVGGDEVRKALKAVLSDIRQF